MVSACRRQSGAADGPAPPWCPTTLPRIAAYTRCPSARARSSRRSTTSPAPSPGARPSARRLNGLQRPSGAIGSVSAALAASGSSAPANTFTPATSA
ncbi:hypothetical protein BJF79_42850 [Actinomadura sp. CNU-125]|nr:hypothetical protein BJF79_42850 [Actinomadura sp. CNU-125]